MSEERTYLQSHRAHDYAHIVERWQLVAEKAGRPLEKFALQGEHPVYCLQTRESLSRNAIYLSAGVHGDEPAAVLGLLEWAESAPERLSALDALVFPCFSPWGLISNSRVDADGRDLNRLFHDGNAHLIREWQALIVDQRFRLALTLHEDYDAQGIYIYEISNRDEHLAADMLEEVRDLIPPDPRPEIEESPSTNGVIRRDITPDNFHLPGLPEAVYLHFHHAETTMTIETPSEFSLHDRVRAQRRLIEAALERIEETPSA